MSLYTENIDRWKMLSDVDYFTQFVKTWVCFNAWYKTSYPTLTTDRAAIDTIKSTNNKVKNHIMSHLNNDYPDDKRFKSLVSELHHNLETKYIYNKGKRITFQDICVEENINKLKIFTHNQITFRAERDITTVIAGKNTTVIESEVLRRGGVQAFFLQQQKYNFADIETSADYLLLRHNWQGYLKITYEEINPYKPICLIHDGTSRDKLEIGDVLFINDKEKICKGIITTLHAIRNVLFHGEIVPDKETNKIYEPAFQILKMIVDSL